MLEVGGEGYFLSIPEDLASAIRDPQILRNPSRIFNVFILRPSLRVLACDIFDVRIPNAV